MITIYLLDAPGGANYYQVLVGTGLLAVEVTNYIPIAKAAKFSLSELPEPLNTGAVGSVYFRFSKTVSPPLITSTWVNGSIILIEGAIYGYSYANKRLTELVPTLSQFAITDFTKG